MAKPTQLPSVMTTPFGVDAAQAAPTTDTVIVSSDDAVPAATVDTITEIPEGMKRLGYWVVPNFVKTDISKAASVDLIGSAMVRVNY